MRNKGSLQNIDNSDQVNYPDGRIKDSTGVGDGTPVSEKVYGDIHEFFSKMMRLYGISYNGLPENEQNGYQLIEALIAVASKNDYVLNLTQSNNVMALPLKIGKLKVGESFIVKSSFNNNNNQTTVRGTLDNVVRNVSFVGSFKQGEHLRATVTSSGLTFTRMVDAFNLDLFSTELGYLKSASGAEVIAGILDNKAVTPESFLEAFAEYVLGQNSDNFLADATRNGIYKKEHFAIVENLGAPKTRNTGVFGPFDINDSNFNNGTIIPSSGQVASVTRTDGISNGDVFQVVVNNAMDNNSYFVRAYIESLGTFNFDNKVWPLVFKVVNTTTFQLYLQESSSQLQSIKVHFEVVQI